MKTISSMKVPETLPIVLTEAETVKMLQVAGTMNIKRRAITELLYATGIRLEECLNLKPRDIKSTEMLVPCSVSNKRLVRFTGVFAEDAFLSALPLLCPENVVQDINCIKMSIFPMRIPFLSTEINLPAFSYIILILTSDPKRWILYPYRTGIADAASFNLIQSATQLRFT
jgi:hypothetical protein